MPDTKLSSELANVLATLDYVEEVRRTVVHIHQQLPRPLYEEFKKVLNALGGTWNKKAHVFPENPRERRFRRMAQGS